MKPLAQNSRMAAVSFIQEPESFSPADSHCCVITYRYHLHPEPAVTVVQNIGQPSIRDALGQEGSKTKGIHIQARQQAKNTVKCQFWDSLRPQKGQRRDPLNVVWA